MLLAMSRHEHRARRFSCPPISLKDLPLEFDTRPHRGDILAVDPNLLAQFGHVEPLVEDPARCIYVVDGHLCLKLLPPILDVERMVETMRLASRVVPVPLVHQFGRSGNCCYVLTDWLIHGRDLFDLRHLDLVIPEWVISAKFEGAVRRVVDGLQSLGIAHNDLYTTNLFVDRYWGIAALIDWDGAREDTVGEQYLRRIQQGTVRPHDWDYLFLRGCHPFGNGFVCSPVDGNSPHGYVEPDVPFVAQTGSSPRARNPQHGLTPALWLSTVKAPAPTLVVLSGGNGNEVVSYLDEGDSPAIAGVRLARVFTQEQADPALCQRHIPTTSVAGLLSFCRPREHELCRRLVRESPSAVLLSHWSLPLSPSFVEAMSCPNDLCDPDSVPRIFTFRACSVDGAQNAIAAIETVIVDDQPVDGTLFVEQYSVGEHAPLAAETLGAERRVVRRMIDEFRASLPEDGGLEQPVSPALPETSCV